MTELKKDPLFPELALRAASLNARSEPSLGVLAEHLSAIADALRKSGQQVSGNHRVVGRAFTIPSQAASHSRSMADIAFEDASDAKVRRAVYGDLARQAYATRRKRSAIFGCAEIFGEPAWDILLDLYIANVENKPVSVSSACIGSAAPPTTGLRWLGVLAEEGLILREHDPEDQRRVLVRLTDRGLAAMDDFFASAGFPA